MAATKKAFKPKPGPDHPWNVRAHEHALASQVKRRRSSGSRDCYADTFTVLREEEDRFEREEAAELQRNIQEFFE